LKRRQAGFYGRKDMKKNWKYILLAAVLCVAFFCASYMAVIKLVVEPRYAYMTDEGVFEEIKELKDTILQREQRIAELEDELEMYRTALSQAGIEEPQ